MANPDPNSKPPQAEAALREKAMQRLFRDGQAPEKVAAELKIPVEKLQRWKEDFLRQLQTASKTAIPRTDRAGNPGAVVSDLSRPHPRTPKPQTLEPGVVAFPKPAEAIPSLNQAEKAELEKTRRLILEKGVLSGDVGRKIGMLPKQMYEANPGESPESHGFSFNQGISEKSRESFARNWDRLGTGQSTGQANARSPQGQMPLPQGVKLTEVEKFSTRLQDLPVLSWLLRGGKTDRAPWLILGMVALASVAAYILIARDKAAHVPTGESQATPYRAATQEEIDGHNLLVQQFFLARSVTDLLPLVRSPEVLRPVMERFYAINPMLPKKVERVSYLGNVIFDKKRYTEHGVRFEGRGTEFKVYVEDTPAGPRIDWETAADYRPIAWTPFQRDKVPDPTNFRFQVRLTTYFDQPFKDPTVWRAFRLEHPEETKMFYGYAMIGSEVEKRLFKLLTDEDAMAEVILTVKRPAGARRDNVVQILDPIVSQSWIVDYQPGQTHFDLIRKEEPAAAKVEAPVKSTDEAPKSIEEPPIPTEAVIKEPPAPTDPKVPNKEPSVAAQILGAAALAPKPKPEGGNVALKPPQAPKAQDPPAKQPEASKPVQAPAKKPAVAVQKKAVATKPKPTSIKPKASVKPKPSTKPTTRSNSQSKQT